MMLRYRFCIFGFIFLILSFVSFTPEKWITCWATTYFHVVDFQVLSLLSDGIIKQFFRSFCVFPSFVTLSLFFYIYLAILCPLDFQHSDCNAKFLQDAI